MDVHSRAFPGGSVHTSPLPPAVGVAPHHGPDASHTHQTHNVRLCIPPAAPTLTRRGRVLVPAHWRKIRRRGCWARAMSFHKPECDRYRQLCRSRWTSQQWCAIEDIAPELPRHRWTCQVDVCQTRGCREMEMRAACLHLDATMSCDPRIGSVEA